MKTSFIRRSLGAFVLAGLLAGAASAQSTYRVGDIVEDFELIDRETGMPVKLSDMEGHIIFLEWFAWWCPFCRAAAAEIGFKVPMVMICSVAPDEMVISHVPEHDVVFI